MVCFTHHPVLFVFQHKRWISSKFLHLVSVEKHHNWNLNVRTLNWKCFPECAYIYVNKSPASPSASLWLFLYHQTIDFAICLVFSRILILILNYDQRGNVDGGEYRARRSSSCPSCAGVKSVANKQLGTDFGSWRQPEEKRWTFAKF